MPAERIRKLLAELGEETRSADLDDDTRSALERLDADIHRLLEQHPEAAEGEQLLERAKRLEADFAASHPVIERMMREVIDTLVKIGV